MEVPNPVSYTPQDENGDGLPNDTWYEAKAAKRGKPETIQDYAITYYRSEKICHPLVGQPGKQRQHGFYQSRNFVHVSEMDQAEQLHRVRGTRLEPEDGRKAVSGKQIVRLGAMWTITVRQTS